MSASIKQALTRLSTGSSKLAAGSIDSSTGDKIQPDVWALWVNVGDGYYYYETDGTNDESVVYYTSSPTFSYTGTDCTPVRAPAAPLKDGYSAAWGSQAGMLYLWICAPVAFRPVATWAFLMRNRLQWSSLQHAY